MKQLDEQENKKENREEHLTPTTSNNNDAIQNAPEIIQLVDIADRMKRRKLYLGLFTEKAQMN